MDIYGDVNIFGDNSQIHLNYNLDSDHKYNGFITYDEVASDIKYGDILYIDLNSRLWKKACANDIKTMPARGIACSDFISSGVKIPILMMGFIYLDMYGAIKNTQLWVSDVTPGVLVDIQHNNIGNYLQTIGFMRSTDVYYFDFCPFYIRVG